MKAAVPVLNQEGPQRCVTPPGAAAVGLLRESVDRADGCAVLVFNADPECPQAVNASALMAEPAAITGASET